MQLEINDFLRQLNFEVERMEALLQIESSGSKIAFAQGYCVGARQYYKALEAAEINAFEKAKQEPYIEAKKDSEGVTVYKTELKFNELENICARISKLKNSEQYAEFQKIKADEIANKKDALFYQSEKGRDLHWAKGWYAAFMQIADWWEMLESHYEAKAEQREKNPSLFEDDDE